MILAAGRRGKHTAMTGDGVGDAPSLKLTPVGIATGMEGSDVAKDASELVLTGEFGQIAGLPCSSLIAFVDKNFDSIRWPSAKAVVSLITSNVSPSICVGYPTVSLV